MKATDAEIRDAADGNICAEQAEKYTSQLSLVMSVPGIQTFSAISVIAEIGVGYVRVSLLEAFMLLGWAYSAEQ